MKKYVRKFFSLTTTLLVCNSLVCGNNLTSLQRNEVYAKTLAVQENYGFMKSPCLYPYEESSFESEVNCFSLYEEQLLPEQYNADVKNLAYVSVAKDQYSTQSCWAFASNSILETALMKKYDVNDPTKFDFSENHMKYALSYESGNNYGYSRTNSSGGNTGLAVMYWARGLNGFNGPVTESADPYDTTKAKRPLEMTSRCMPENYYVSKVVKLDIPYSAATPEERDASVNSIKEAVYKYGACTVGYDATSNTNYYNKNPKTVHENICYYKKSNNPNNIVTIVGWDDTYSADNFNPKSKPPCDGAFLVKNSWGKDWGMDGFFWMSYDTNMLDLYSVAEVDIRDELFDHIYEYDELGYFTFQRVEGDHAYYSNDFKTTDDDVELLTAVSTHCIFGGTNYKIFVDTDTTDDVGAQEVAIKNYENDGTSYQVDEAGYHTFKLEQPIEVHPNYSVIIYMQSDRENQYIPVERYNSNITNRMKYSGKGKSGNELETLVADGKSDMCLKAFTKELPKEIVNHNITSVTDFDTDYNKSGTVGNMPFENADCVIASLPSTIKAILDDATEVEIPISWEDTSNYDPNKEGTYSFTASFKELPEGVTDDNHIALPVVTMQVNSAVTPTPLLPEQYNADVKNLTYVSEVKNQYNTGVCWAFASNSILETALMKKYNVNDPTTFDFSENHMKYALSYESGNNNGYSRSNDGFGNPRIAMAYWARGLNGLSGPVAESADPFDTTKAKRPLEMTLCCMPENYYVSKFISVPIPYIAKTPEQRDARTNSIKETVYKYGACTVGYDETSNINYYNKNPKTEHENICFYIKSNYPDHEVTIVGWDDTYSADNFNPKSKPPCDGAFLVKNSRGKDWGMDGFFWMSYDTNILDINAIAEVDVRDELFDHIYEYDELGYYSSLEVKGDHAYYSNDFKTTDDDVELLTAVSTYCVDGKTNYKILVDTDTTDDVEAQEVAIKNYENDGTSYQVDEPGYHTFKLEQPIEVHPNFSVIIYMQSDRQNQYIPIECYDSNITNRMKYSGKGKSGNELETLAADGKSDMCLKAFTKELPEEITKEPIITVTPTEEITTSFERLDTETTVKNATVDISIENENNVLIHASDFSVKNSEGDSLSNVMIQNISGMSGEQQLTLNILKSIENDKQYTLWYKDQIIGTFKLVKEIVKHNITSVMDFETDYNMSGTAGNMPFENANCVIASLPSNIKVTLDDANEVEIPLSWEDASNYDPNKEGIYSFTSSFKELPEGVTDDNHIVLPVVTIQVHSAVTPSDTSSSTTSTTANSSPTVLPSLQAVSSSSMSTTLEKMILKLITKLHIIIKQ